jgi:hypothetical protein
MFVLFGLSIKILCRRSLVFRENKRPDVIKLLILWVFLLKRIVLIGKHRSKIVLKSLQNSSRLVLTSLELYTSCHVMLLRWVRKLLILVGFISRKLFVLCFLPVGGVVSVKKLIKWSLMSEIIVPVLMFSGELEFVSMWSIKEWESPCILVD